MWFGHLYLFFKNFVSIFLMKQTHFSRQCITANKIRKPKAKESSGETRGIRGKPDENLGSSKKTGRAENYGLFWKITTFTVDRSGSIPLPDSFRFAYRTNSGLGTVIFPEAKSLRYNQARIYRHRHRFPILAVHLEKSYGHPDNFSIVPVFQQIMLPDHPGRNADPRHLRPNQKKSRSK